MSVDLIKEEIFFNGISFPSKKSATLVQIFSIFGDKTSLSSQDLALQLFEAKEYDVSLYHRLRMALSRINKECQTRYGIVKAFQLHFDKCHLDPNIKIRFKN